MFKKALLLITIVLTLTLSSNSAFANGSKDKPKVTGYTIQLPADTTHPWLQWLWSCF